MTVVIEIGIGLCLIFALFSTLVSALQEMFARWFNRRGRHLEAAVLMLLDGARPSHSVCSLAGICALFRTRRHPHGKMTLGNELLHHGLVRSLSDGERLPSYLPAETFADALVDLLQHRAPGAVTPAGALAGGVQYLKGTAPRTDLGIRPQDHASVVKALLAIQQKGNGDVALFKAGVIEWYNNSMDRVTGWYKRETQTVQFFIGLILVCVCNLDTFYLADVIAKDDALRAGLVAEAKTITDQNNQNKTPDGMTPEKQIGDTLGAIEKLKLPLGWSGCSISGKAVSHGNCFTNDAWDNLKKIAGLWVAAMALSLGAPFWFDLMQRLLNLRGGGVKPDDSNAKATTAGTTGAAAATTASPAAGAAPPTGMNAVETNLLSVDDIRQIQTRLGAPLTGILDAATRECIKAYQQLKGSAVDGYLTVDQAAALVDG